ncbi:hypothetical protein RRG08_005808, partial [Elysia crispata]
QLRIAYDLLLPGGFKLSDKRCHSRGSAEGANPAAHCKTCVKPDLHLRIAALASASRLLPNSPGGNVQGGFVTDLCRFKSVLLEKATINAPKGKSTTPASDCRDRKAPLNSTPSLREVPDDGSTRGSSGGLLTFPLGKEEFRKGNCQRGFAPG